MNKVFCVSCGHKILYEVAKPKFCSHCGEPIGNISSATKKEEKEETSDLDVNLNKLKRDIVVEGGSRGVNLKELWGSVTQEEASSGVDKFQRPASKDPSGQELLDKTIKDCSSSRMRDIDE
jgi:ribosomal protein L37E